MDDDVKTQISEWADEFTTHLEVDLTEDVCKCEWIYQVPKDEPLPEGTKRYRSRSHQHPECPAHTKRGLIVGFFEWAMEKKGWVGAVQMEETSIVRHVDPTPVGYVEESKVEPKRQMTRKEIAELFDIPPELLPEESYPMRPSVVKAMEELKGADITIDTRLDSGENRD